MLLRKTAILTRFYGYFIFDIENNIKYLNFPTSFRVVNYYVID